MSDNHRTQTLLPVPGVRLGTACAGIKKVDRRDLVVIELAAGAQVAAVFTRNAFCAAPVTVAREHLARQSARYVLINTGNANAGTGARGIQDAISCCDKIAELTGCDAQQVLPFSTGVIGEPLPVARIRDGLPKAMDALSASGWADAAMGILTTDTVPKAFSRQIAIQDRTVTITGIAKGSGMIRPDMATMLAFIATDAGVPHKLLQGCLEDAANASFNRITVDGDTSTNDACLLLATAQSGVTIKDSHSADYARFAAAVTELCEALALAIVRDGEGATKLITVQVEAGATQQECLDVAYTIAHSPLVKTAFFASDPNWGRLLAAIGRSGIQDLNIDAVQLYLGDVRLVCNGGLDPEYREERGQRVMDQKEITVRVVLGRGTAQARVWTCDFSYDYVRINAEYRT